MLTESQLRAALRRGALLIGGLAVGVAAAAGVSSTLMPDDFVASQGLTVTPPLISAEGSLGREANQTRLLSTNAALLTSDSVLARVGESSGLSTEELRGRLTIQTDANSDLVTVSFRDSEESKALDNLEAVVETARRTQVEAEMSRIDLALVGINEQLAEPSSPSDPALGPTRVSLETARANLSAARAALTSSIQPVAQPVTREVAQSPAPPVAVGAGATVGALVGACLVIARARLRARILDVDDVRSLDLLPLSRSRQSAAQVARSLSNAMRGGSLDSRAVVSVHMGKYHRSVDESVIALAESTGNRIHVIRVGAADVALDSRSHNPSVVSGATFNEDQVFAGDFYSELRQDAGVWVYVTIAASEEAVIRACAVVGAAALLIGEGELAGTVGTLAKRLNESAVSVVGAAVIGKRAHREASRRRVAVEPGVPA